MKATEQFTGKLSQPLMDDEVLKLNTLFCTVEQSKMKNSWFNLKKKSNVF